MKNGKGEIKTEYEELLTIMEIEIKNNFTQRKMGKRRSHYKRGMGKRISNETTNREKS